MKNKLHALRGGNLDIDLIPNTNLNWNRDVCPWNVEEGEDTHKCAIKDVSICKYFQGIQPLDTVLCSYKKDS